MSSIDHYKYLSFSVLLHKNKLKFKKCLCRAQENLGRKNENAVQAKRHDYWYGKARLEAGSKATEARRAKTWPQVASSVESAASIRRRKEPQRPRQSSGRSAHSTVPDSENYRAYSVTLPTKFFAFQNIAPFSNAWLPCNFGTRKSLSTE